MFTGIIEERGKVVRAEPRGSMLEVEVVAPAIAAELERGDSIAVDGVCLSATRVRRKRFAVQVVAETLARTTFDDLEAGAHVNLELAIRLIDRLGGHLVQGHVDGVAAVVKVETDGAMRRVSFAADKELVRYLAPKGSVALDGVSLTVAGVDGDVFEVALIPHTLQATTLAAKLRNGSRVNMEVDVLVKYIERLMERN